MRSLALQSTSLFSSIYKLILCKYTYHKYFNANYLYTLITNNYRTKYEFFAI